MAKKGLLLCVCQGTCPSFQEMDIFEVGNTLRREKLIDYFAIHPQLCARDGDVFLESLLKGDTTDKLYVAACDPLMQTKMFRDALENAGFDPDNHVGIDIRNKNTEEAIEALKELLSEA
jgi:heterodisulfide reductase subunit A-like polyferredoxin